MSKEIEETEALLRQLKPEQPLDRLREKIRETLRSNDGAIQTASRRKVLPWIWLPIAAAACLAIVFSIRTMDIKRGVGSNDVSFDVDELSMIGATEMESIKLLSESKALVAAEQSPVFYLNSGVPAREIYLKYLDTYKYQSGSFAKPIVVTYPREEIRIVPVISD